MSYVAPIQDMLFCMKELAGLEKVSGLPGFEDATLETAEAVLEECARLAQQVLAPLNRTGDQNPSVFDRGAVSTPAGFKEAFRQFASGGWQGLQHPQEFGGQGLPKTIGVAAIEMLNSANMSFALCPLLTDGAIEALMVAGTSEQRQRYIPKMISGEWTGTMNLTEPQAGSDLALVRTRAEPCADGRFKLHGTKIYITYGEHDLADNIVHLVLARIAGAPEGVKGISLFLVPKLQISAECASGERNDVQCVSIEHKLGIRASPTAVLQFGDFGGAVGELVGEANRGLETMFVMMNAARYAVGVQGIAIAERAYQQALEYAKERVQSRPVDNSSSSAVPILNHPDVKRMLMTMRAHVEAARSLAFFAAAAHDFSHHAPDAEERERHKALYEFLVPLVKGYGTEMSQDVTGLAVQVHGGMGFIEETGVAQHLRDARILTIYEGTTAIQANDLVGRKTVRDGGRLARAMSAQIADTETQLQASASVEAKAMRSQLAAAREAFDDVVDFVLKNHRSDPKAVFAGAVPYLMLAGQLVAGWQLARSLLIAEQRLAEGEGNASFLSSKKATAHFYADHVLAKLPALRHSIVEGSASVNALNVNGS